LQAQVEVHLTSSAATANYCEIVSQLAPATNISFHDANWENYEDLLDPPGEANGPPISDNEAELQVLTPISTGENQLIFEWLNQPIQFLNKCLFNTHLRNRSSYKCWWGLLTHAFGIFVAVVDWFSYTRPRHPVCLPPAERN
jgi:hypothetical protein